MIVLKARGKFQSSDTTVTCSVEDSRIRVVSDSPDPIRLALAVDSALRGKEFTVRNVDAALKSRVFDLGSKVEVTGWLRKVV